MTKSIPQRPNLVGSPNTFKCWWRRDTRKYWNTAREHSTAWQLDDSRALPLIRVRPNRHPCCVPHPTMIIPHVHEMFVQIQWPLGITIGIVPNSKSHLQGLMILKKGLEMIIVLFLWLIVNLSHWRSFRPPNWNWKCKWKVDTTLRKLLSTGHDGERRRCLSQRSVATALQWCSVVVSDNCDSQKGQLGTSAFCVLGGRGRRPIQLRRAN